MKLTLILAAVLIPALAPQASGMDRSCPIEKENSAVFSDALARHSPRLCSRRAPRELHRREGLVGAIPMLRGWAPVRHRTNEAKKIAPLAIVTRPVHSGERTNGRRGLLVTTVGKGGIGQQSGLVAGDIIVGLDDGISRTMDEMAGVLCSLRQGETVSLTVIRGTHEDRDVLTLHVTG